MNYKNKYYKYKLKYLTLKKIVDVIDFTDPDYLIHKINEDNIGDVINAPQQNQEALQQNQEAHQHNQEALQHNQEAHQQNQEALQHNQDLSST